MLEFVLKLYGSDVEGYIEKIKSQLKELSLNLEVNVEKVGGSDSTFPFNLFESSIDVIRGIKRAESTVESVKESDMSIVRVSIMSEGWYDYVGGKKELEEYILGKGMMVI